MKAKLKERREAFKPATIVFTIETENELIELFHRLNMSIEHIKPVLDKHYHSGPFPHLQTKKPLLNNLFKVVNLIGLELAKQNDPEWFE